MTVVASVDYPAKRIHLHQDTAIAGVFNPIDAYREIRAQRTAGIGRNFRPGIKGGGNLPKTATTRTQRFAILSSGWRFVPFDGDHTLTLTVEAISPSESISNLDLFDLLPLSPSTNVRLRESIPQVEIILVPVGSGLSAEESEQLRELHLMRGLDAARPVSVTQTQETAGDVVLDIGGDGVTLSTLTRR